MSSFRATHRLVTTPFLLDATSVASLQRELRRTMRALLADLCDELATRYRGEAQALRLPVPLFRRLGGQLSLRDYSGWKTVGWIEELNDLVYFVDLAVQLRNDPAPAEFAAALFSDCQQTFYESSYLEDLFPAGRTDPAGLAARLRSLCARLARRVTQEAVFLAPWLSCVWVAETGRRWSVPADLGADFERAELPGCPAIGPGGAYLVPPAPLRRMLKRAGWRTRLEFRSGGMDVRVGRSVFPCFVRSGDGRRWLWREVRPCLVGPALIYGRDRTPRSVAASPAGLGKRIETALEVIQQAWPDGAGLLAGLTTRVVPLRARGVVSFSYRHRPGLSFINIFDRGRLDLLDDLVHENSHHHLNLLLRKYRLLRGAHTEEIFYSPWRRSLRPLRGILHATFTFTMGAMLFERLSAWGARGPRRAARGMARLTEQEVLRARFRCLEEIASVEYSLRDLDYAATKLGWLTAAGKSLVDSLRREIQQAKKRIGRYEASVLRSRYGPALNCHRQELANARKTYGPGIFESGWGRSQLRASTEHRPF
jgi:hypothetical protein